MKDMSEGSDVESRLKRLLEGPVDGPYSHAIFNQLTGQYTKGTIKQLKTEGRVYEAVMAIAEKCVQKEEYETSAIPTFLSPGKGRSLLLGSEPGPTMTEILEWFYLMLSGVRWRWRFILNLVNVKESMRSDFRKKLIGDEMVTVDGNADFRGIQNITGAVVPPLSPHIAGFAFLNFFVAWHKRAMRLSRERESEDIGYWGIDSLFKEWSIDDDTILMIVDTGTRGEKGSLFFVPRVSEFLRTWYGDYFSNPNVEHPPLGLYVSSHYISDRDYRDKSCGLLEKFLYYLMRGHVNGEILDKLLLLKVDYELSKERGPVYGIRSAKEFFSALG